MNKKEQKKIIRNLILFFIVVVVISAFFFLEYRNIIEIEKIREFIMSFGMMGPIIFIFIYIILILVGFSAGVLTATAGAIFGIKLGFIVVIIGATIGGNIAFLIGRYFTEKFEKLARVKRLKTIVNKIKENAKERGFVSLLTLKFSFVPYIWLCYLSGIVKDLKYKDFLLATLITNVFGSMIYLFLGYSITQNLTYFVIAIIGFIIIMITATYLNKRVNKNIKED